MYLPADFREQDPERLLSVMRGAPFAAVICSDAHGEPLATPVPVLTTVTRGEGRAGDGAAGVAVTLHWHLARGNPQAEALPGRSTLVVFQGPHALVDAGWYVSAPQVGTWNYVTVQARGQAERVEGDEAREVARALTRTLTPDAPGIPAEFEERMLRGVVTFRLPVRSLDGKFKLSQNKGAADRAAVRAHLQGSARDEDRALAALIPD